MEIEEFQHGDKTFQKAIFGISNCRYSDERNKINKKSIKTVFTTRKLLIETSIEEMQLEALGEFEVEFQKREKLITIGFFWNFGRRMIPMQPTKSMVFSLILPHMCDVIDWDHDRGIGTYSDWGIQVWILSKINIKSTFWNFWTFTNLRRQSNQKVWYLNPPPEKSFQWRIWVEKFHQ